MSLVPTLLTMSNNGRGQHLAEGESWLGLFDRSPIWRAVLVNGMRGMWGQHLKIQL